VSDESRIRDLVATWHHATAVGDVAQVLALTANLLAPDQAGARGR
jgi:hypothetical protein